MAAEHRLTFHVVSDSLEGVVKVTRARWTEIVYRFPRTALKEAGNVEELQGSGIYFLMGVKEGKQTLYIGQAQNIYRRLSQHSVNDSKVFWTHTLAVTSTGEAIFNAAHLNYLESRFHDLATEAGALNIENSMPPSVGCGIATIQQEMDECINHTKVIFNLMGYHFLEKAPSSPMAIEPQQVDAPSLPVISEPTEEADDVPIPQRLDGVPPAPQVLAGAQGENTGVRRPKYNFYEMGLKDGDVVVYADKDPAHRTEATVCGANKILVDGEVITPYALAKRFRRTKNVYAFAYISWKGEKLSAIYDRVYTNDAPAKKEEEPQLRYCTVAGADAVGRLTEDGGIVVLKGSRICAETKKSCPPSAATLRAEVGEDCITQKDYAFKSLSGAACFVGGSALSGNVHWKEVRQEPKRKQRSKTQIPDAQLRYCTVAGADAVGQLTEDGGIVVLKGSRICAETKKSCPPSAAALRAEVGADGITQTDYTFNTLSGAACFVGGCTINGNRYWTETRQEPKRKQRSKTQIPDALLRYCTVAGADAVGRLTEDGGIVVLKGSRICAETKKTCSAMAATLRAEVGEDCITQKDYAFKSLSGAAQFVGGCALNGHICWTEVRQEPKRKKG